VSATVALRDGSVYLDVATFERFLGTRDAVTLLRQGGDLYIVPLQDSTLGGYLCKRRTAAGDRVVHATEFFREHGLEVPITRQYPAAWRDDIAALVVPGVFPAAG